MSFIEIKSGGPDINPGTYPVVLMAISDPRTVLAQRGARAGQEVDLLDWTFTIDLPNSPFHGQDISGSTSTASGPKSKLFMYLTALFGGVKPPVGTKLEKDQLVGRRALATIDTDDGGWLRITNLSAMPVTAPATPVPAAVAAPAVAASSTDLPF